MIPFLFQSIDQLRLLIERVTSEFPNAIGNYNFYRTYKIFKHEYMVPQILKKKKAFDFGVI